MKETLLCVTLLVLSYPPTAGAEPWAAHPIDSEGRGADGVRLADVNGDGLLDIASGWEEAGETRVYLHPGPGRVTEPWPKVVVGESGPVEDAAFCDLDSDGFVDVVSASEDGNLYVHWAPKSRRAYRDSAAWRTEAIPAARGVQKWMITASLQIDGKNGPDLLAAGKGTQVVWFELPPDARDLDAWRKHVISDRGGWTMGLVAVDLDGDGDRDALLGVRDGNPGVRWFENPGPGPGQRRSWKARDVGAPDPTGFVAVTDLDRDGLLDVLAPRMGARGLRLHRGLTKGATRWETIEIGLPAERNKGVAVGDVDLDGRDDLVVSHEFAAIHVLRHDGSLPAGHWRRETVASGGKFDDVTLYDIDRDGDLDLLTTDEQGLQVVWYENPRRRDHRGQQRGGTQVGSGR